MEYSHTDRALIVVVTVLIEQSSLASSILQLSSPDDESEMSDQAVAEDLRTIFEHG